MEVGKGAARSFAERFSSAKALIEERSAGSDATMLLDERSMVCSEEVRLGDVKIGPNEARDWPFTILKGIVSKLMRNQRETTTHKDLSEREPTELGSVEPILELRTRVNEPRDLADAKASSDSADSPVFSISRAISEFSTGNEPVGRLPSPVILRLVKVETDDNSDGITAGTPGKVRTLHATLAVAGSKAIQMNLHARNVTIRVALNAIPSAWLGVFHPTSTGECTAVC